MPSSDHPVSAINEPLRLGGKFFREGGSTCLVKAVTFGPFPPGAFPDEGRGQLPRIREELGANALRLFEVPSLGFLHACASEGLRVFITIPWTQHVDFVRRRSALAEADERLLETITRFRGHPAVAGYFVANEVESTLVRWMGASAVVEQIERLIDLGHANDPGTFFAYANYPGTEYLLPQNQDFVAFNLYLEDREAYAAYLARLQNLAGNKPLFLSEFGIDAQSHGEEKQAEILRWAVEEAAEAGVAGVTLFSWSDLWQRGGKQVAGWSFGLTRDDQAARPALGAVRECWEELKKPSDVLSLGTAPRVSVIVCTHRGSATLVPCLDSLVALDYPDFEVIVVNDGNDSRVAEIATSYQEVRHLGTEHEGLGAARNTGAGVATGEIFAYTDDDCVVDPEWLKWIAHQFDSDPSLGCAGGPNLPPRPETATRARVAAAPGGPTHVLLDDLHAEHLPGCNLAVRREVFKEVGGFHTVFRAAGDDVDFCWRVLAAGYGLGFHAAAFVWHHRRFTWRAYLKQQIGYGRAEALLMPMHPERFRGAGGAVWKGRVYVSRRRFGPFVYHGHYGHEPFQLMYPGGDSWFGEVALHFLWWAVMLAFAIGGIFFAPLFCVAGLMLFGTGYVAFGRAGRSPVEPEFDTTTSRFALTGLIVAQGIVRSGSRLLAGWRHANWGRSLQFVGGTAAETLAKGWWKLGDELEFWSDRGLGREELLAAILSAYPGAEDDSSGKTDVILRQGRFWNWAVITVTEYHEDEGRLTRLRVLARPQPLMRLLVSPALLVLPFAVALGFGFQNELLTFLLVFAVIFVAARLFMWAKHPRFHRIAREAGFEVV
ncbi:MAG: glycosyltransferase [Verrucomicrobiae bacterium]|nr:glycosyltransferase [Verrucomicrobiae bacterium]